MENFYYAVFCVLALVLGITVGSFLNVVIYRLPEGKSVAKGGSFCPKCKTPIKFYDNIPILSYIILRGKCRSCGEKISFRYPFVEALNGILWLLLALLSYKSGYLYAAITMLFCSVLIIIAFIDYKEGIIYDRFNILIAILSIPLIIWGNNLWWHHLLGFGVCLLFFGGAYLVSRLILKREGIGLGDVKLMCVCGLYLAAENVFLATLIGTTLASIILLIRSKKNKEQRFTEYPFAPYLAVGLIIAAIFGDIIIDFYLSLF